MRIVFVGCVHFSRAALQQVLASNGNVVGIVTRQTSAQNSDHSDLSDIATDRSIPYKFVNDINHVNNIAWIKEQAPDIIFCFGWSSLLKKELLELAPMGVVGFHPAELPYNRGRHPIIWALVLGLSRTGSTFFFMDEGADSGDILSQHEIAIDYADDAQRLYEKITKTALKQIADFMLRLQNGTYEKRRQDLSKGNVWRKRGAADGKIDWRMSSRSVYNLVRALADPYPGAHTVYQGRDVKVWQVIEMQNKEGNLEPGKILAVSHKSIVVKTGDGAVSISRHEFEPLPAIGEYLL